MKQWLHDIHNRVVRSAMIVLMAVGGLVLGGGSIVGCKTIYPEKPDQRPELRRRADKEQRDLDRKTKDYDDEKRMNLEQ